MTVNWTGDDGNPYESSDEKSFDPGTPLNDNGAKFGKYNPLTKEITWTIYTNTHQSPLNGAKITDQLSVDQVLIEDSIKVFHYTIGPDGNPIRDQDLRPIDYTLTITPATETAGAKIEIAINLSFIGGLSSIGVEFKTSLDNRTIADTYENQAVFKNNNLEYPISGEVSVPHGGELIEKAGVQAGENIDWTININFSQSTISEAVVEDSPSNNQIILPDTFHIYGTNVDANGNVTINTSDELVAGEDYILELGPVEADGTQTFKISFLTTINKPYVLKYSSYIDADDREAVTNQVNISGKNIVDISEDSQETVIVRDSNGEGSGTGHRGSLQINKTDGQLKGLIGAKFELYNEDGSILLRSGTTDAQGVLNFEEIRSGDYILKEVEAPSGYWLDPILAQGIPVHLENSDELTENNITVSDLVNNPTKITLTKEDAQHNTIPGATYALIDTTSGAVVAQATTDENGKIVFEAIPFGTYIIREISAPNGWLVNTDDKLITLKPDATNRENNMNVTVLEYKGSAYLYKVNPENKPLAGAKFALRYNGQIIQQDLTTDVDGYIHLLDLAPGTYQIYETSAPDGYVLDSKPIQFIIPNAADGEPQEVNIGTFVNHLPPPELPVTGNDQPAILVIVGLFGSITGLIIYLKRSKRQL